MQNSVKQSIKSARKVGLLYNTDQISGIARKSKGRSIYYVTTNGKKVTTKTTLKRIQLLMIPPAWTDVWIAPNKNHHLQATGLDAKKRKQYRYHPRWREIRDTNKYSNLVTFAKVLPRIRRRVSRDLKKTGLTREKVLAAIVRLLETSLIRVGNDEYAKENHSFGLTTMLNRHVKVRGKKLSFHFRGKSGVEHESELESATIAKVVKHCQELPGQELFEYLDEDEKVHDVRSEDVNNYLREISGKEISAKDFRTWAGTVLAAQALREFETFDSDVRAKRNVTRAIEKVAGQLGNTSAVCRKCYIHPAIIDAYMDRSLIKTLQSRVEGSLKKSLKALKSEEGAVLAFLQERMKRELDNHQSARLSQS